ncbi:hypothetical protein MSPP1_004016 [Malassezia sp. CBS 17886]|nr:hypothetical protein MSPP1_004016 [Malassezia sp. CBS 17886]
MSPLNLVAGVCALVMCALARSTHVVPYVDPEQVQLIAARQPGRIEKYDSDDVHRGLALDKNVRPGAKAAHGWVDPAQHGGSMLDLVGTGFREPINVLILSGASDASVLSDQGLLDYARSIGFSFECLHIHLGGLQHANLGDGHGYVPQLFEYRSLMYHGSPGVYIGTCWESLVGGNHFRAWRQNGSLADTGAWFLATSKEEAVSKSHTISTDGYDVGRNLVVQAATKGGSYGGRSWRASVHWQTGLLSPGNRGINHNISIDGRVAVLTVRQVASL